MTAIAVANNVPVALVLNGNTKMAVLQASSGTITRVGGFLAILVRSGQVQSSVGALLVNGRVTNIFKENGYSALLSGCTLVDALGFSGTVGQIHTAGLSYQFQ